MTLTPEILLALGGFFTALISGAISFRTASQSSKRDEVALLRDEVTRLQGRVAQAEERADSAIEKANGLIVENVQLRAQVAALQSEIESRDRYITELLQMKFGIIIDDGLYEAPGEFVREVLPILAVENIDQLDEKTLIAKGFRRIKVKPLKGKTQEESK